MSTIELLEQMADVAERQAAALRRCIAELRTCDQKSWAMRPLVTVMPRPPDAPWNYLGSSSDVRPQPGLPIEVRYSASGGRGLYGCSSHVGGWAGISCWRYV